MKVSLIITLFSVFIFFESSGQKILTKPEIHSFWIKEMAIQERSWFNNFSNFYFEDSIQNELVKRIKVLQEKFDTLGLIVISMNETMTKDSCENGSYPSQAFFLWKSSDKIYLQKITSRCIYPAREVKGIGFFDFYKEKSLELKGEYIMPVILGATEKEGKIIYDIITTSHEASYVIYCKMNQSAKVLHFSESDIANQQGIFYQDNLKSNAYKWFLYTKNDITRFPCCR